MSCLILILIAFLCPATLATFGPVVDADWAGQYPYVVNFQSPADAFQVTNPGLVLSAKMAMTRSSYFLADPLSYVMTDHNLQVHPVAKVVAMGEPPFAVFKTCKRFGTSRFNLTLSEFFDYAANDTDAALLFFAGDSLKSSSTAVLSDSTCASLVSPGFETEGACIPQDTTPGACSIFAGLPGLLNRAPLLAVHGRVQAALMTTQCAEDASLDHTGVGEFFKIDAARDSIVNIPDVVIDNP